MPLIYDYKTIARPRHLGELKVPAIPIRLMGPKAEFETAALLDSGADKSVIFKEQADVLGVEIEEKNKTKVNGIGGMVEAAPTNLRVEVKGRGEHRAFTLEVEFYVILSEKEEFADYPVILGRKDFFNFFDITISESKKRIWLKPVLPRGY